MPLLVCPRMGPFTPQNLGLLITLKTRKELSLKIRKVTTGYCLRMSMATRIPSLSCSICNMKFEETVKRCETPGEKQPSTPAPSAVDAFLEVTPAVQVRVMTCGSSKLPNCHKVLILGHMGLPEISGLHCNFSNLSIVSYRALLLSFYK